MKGTIHGNIIENGLEKQFIGGHPMTGSNRSGYENSSETLMENAYYLLTPTSSTPECATTFMKTLIIDIGSIPYVLDYHSHDDITAAISHLPHILAASLVNIVHDHDDTESHMRTFAAGGFKDITRIASSSPEMWESICLSNPECITKYLRLFRESLDCVESFIHQKNSVALFQLFETAKNYRDSLSNNSTGTLPKVHEIYVDVPDAPGIIAIIATILSSNSVNIKNIGIVHNREFENGVLRIEFDNEDNLESALNALEKYPYTVYNR